MGRPDRNKAGRSQLVPFVAGESAGERHARRLQTNLNGGRAEVQAWCAERGVTLEIKNGGHHWIFRRETWIAEWWPSSAKLVIEKRWNQGVHVHDWQQAIRILDRRAPRPAKGATP